MYVFLFVCPSQSLDWVTLLENSPRFFNPLDVSNHPKKNSHLAVFGKNSHPSMVSEYKKITTLK
jgi:hypothetical protein